MALVITYAAAIQLSIAQVWFKGRSVPQFEWLGRLNVIMVINEESLIRFTCTLSKNNRCTSRLHNLNLETARLEHFTHQRRAFFQSQVLRAHAGLRDEARKLGQAFVEILFEIGI